MGHSGILQRPTLILGKGDSWETPTHRDGRGGSWGVICNPSSMLGGSRRTPPPLTTTLAGQEGGGCKGSGSLVTHPLLHEASAAPRPPTYDAGCTSNKTKNQLLSLPQLCKSNRNLCITTVLPEILRSLFMPLREDNLMEQ
ncbi:hypothetical protein FH972_020212 [Carpinus fangiana]|uniref:Uncharacterized protein n=1 Tax=Carpinus fangiana TaxID=176857 RepID=A0A5N6RVR4_9ROSI|nr:hypothetical protein FH972_020212 [Carpinus fangiana]